MLRQDVAGCRRKRGHVAQRTVEVAELGRGATDAAIFDFARKHGAVVVTINQGDFIALATNVPDPPSIILLPAARGPELCKLLRIILRAAGSFVVEDARFALRIALNGTISSGM